MSRHALLLGTTTFPADRDLAALPGVRQDVGQMKSLLDEAGEFDSVDAYLDLTRERFVAVLEDFFGTRGTGDLALLYYSGHGLMLDRDRESLFLATSDTTTSLPHTTALDIDGVLRHLLNITKAKQKVVLLDCCFSGAFSARSRFRGGVREEPRRGIRERGTFILTSSTHTRASKAQSSHQPSLFTDIMLRGLRGEAHVHGENDWITTHDLARYAQAEMARRNPDHLPTESSEGVTKAIELIRSKHLDGQRRRTTPVKGMAPNDNRFSTDHWRRLINYYISCMERAAHLTTFVDLKAHASYRTFPEGPESTFSGKPIPLSTEWASWARRVTSEGGSLFYGYPIVVPRQRPKPVFAPLLVADASISPDGQLHATLPPQPNVALARDLGLSSMEIEELVQQVAGTFIPNDPHAVSKTIHQLMRILDLKQVTPIDPGALTGTVIAGPLRGVQNSAVLYITDNSDATQRNLIKDLQQISKEPASTAGTALGVLADTEPNQTSTPAGDVIPVAPDRLNEAQEQVLQAAMTQRLTVAQGPPGTGKSQLVTALVATATATGQTVLVASTNNQAVNEVRDRTLSTVGPGLIIRTGNRDYQSKEPSLLTETLETHRQTPPIDERTPAAELRIISEEIARLRASLDARRLLERDLAELAAERPVTVTSTDSSVSVMPIPDDDKALNRLVRLIDRALGRGILGWWARRKLRSRGLVDRQAIEDFAHTVTVELRFQNNRQQISALPDEQKEWSRLAQLGEERMKYSRDLLKAQLGRRVRDGAAVLQQRCSEMSKPRANSWQQFTALLHYLPAWAVTALSARTFPPRPALFDLVIIDEAAQCSIPAVLPLLYRAKRALIIGDPRQLQPVITLPRKEDQTHQANAGISSQWLTDRQLEYTQHSAFDAFEAVAGGVYLLNEHYRCHPDIVAEPNRQVYQGRLTVLTDQSRLAVATETAVRWHHIDGVFSHGRAGSGFNEPELNEVIAEVSRLLRAHPQASIGVVTPLAAQQRQLTVALGRAGLSENDVACGTIHRFQGGERDIMIISPVGTHGIRDTTRKWLVHQINLWNVAITRARSQLIVVGDQSWWSAQSGLLAALATSGSDETDAVPTGTHTADVLHTELRRRGFNVRRDVRVDGYHYDIVITKNNDGCSLAILVDAPQGDPSGQSLRKKLALIDVASSSTPVFRAPAWKCLADTRALVDEISARFNALREGL